LVGFLLARAQCGVRAISNDIQNKRKIKRRANQQPTERGK